MIGLVSVASSVQEERGNSCAPICTLLSHLGIRATGGPENNLDFLVASVRTPQQFDLQQLNDNVWYDALAAELVWILLLFLLAHFWVKLGSYDMTSLLDSQ